MGLQQLRANPRAASATNVYFLKPPQGAVGPTECIIGELHPGTTPGFVTLTMVVAPGNGIDYFFPYLHGAPRGVTVPANPLRGAIAATTGMNGCALEVVVKNGDYVFYHDRNANSMGLVNVPGGIGTTVCRVGPSTYWDANWAVGQARMMRTPQYQFMCVYVGNYWHVLCFRIATDHLGAVRSGGPGLPGGGSYVGYFNQTVRLRL